MVFVKEGLCAHSQAKFCARPLAAEKHAQTLKTVQNPVVGSVQRMWFVWCMFSDNLPLLEITCVSGVLTNNDGIRKRLLATCNAMLANIVANATATRSLARAAASVKFRRDFFCRHGSLCTVLSICRPCDHI